MQQKSSKDWKQLFGKNDYELVIDSDTISGEDIFQVNNGKIKAMYRYKDSAVSPIAMIISKRNIHFMTLNWNTSGEIENLGLALIEKGMRGYYCMQLLFRKYGQPVWNIKFRKGMLGIFGPFWECMPMF